MSASDRASTLSGGELVASITVRGGRGGDRGILAGWSDGRLVWSADQVNGGPPYYDRAIDAERITNIPRELAAHGVAPGTEMRYTGPDATWSNLQVFHGAHKVLDLGSWHEPAEARADLVVTATGIEPLGNRTRDEVLARQPAEYRAFRELWDRAKAQLLELIPDTRDAHETHDHPWR